MHQYNDHSWNKETLQHDLVTKSALNNLYDPVKFQVGWFWYMSINSFITFPQLGFFSILFIGPEEHMIVRERY